VVESALWTGWPLNNEEDDDNIRIIDLGKAFNTNTIPQPLGLSDNRRFWGAAPRVGVKVGTDEV